MSLAQHVTQAEGFDFEGSNSSNPYSTNEGICESATPGFQTSASNGDQEWRFMDFAPADSTSEEPHIAAYKVPFAKRCAQVATGAVACWLSAGIVFGFAALKPVLIAEGIYSGLCESNVTVGVGNDQTGRGAICAEQDLRLNLFFIVASVTTNVSSLLAGWALDRYGRRACWVSACLSLIVGSLLMSGSFALRGLDGYLLGNVFLALGGLSSLSPASSSRMRSQSTRAL
ncbi:MFS transporter [Penicillium canescens]|uniref:MFS transporter n=1 Tax=Penicillium canescens TaxID=5083 RepID=A0AAD6N4Y0_PENCN|nr:MFS transporter [Penicillium canescens]KAJ6030386.1 MFS transporter [Penicillium canescens]KAJ6060759.1 MFS transporter [Penicillium canescens]KAJ6064121.1 MFS transporter [Penicillium canescens]KAJ6077617.1 MFS transporter [Penicillium canescens]KAJ6154383.1 MFS transporter [Penicillium canescens]